VLEGDAGKLPVAGDRKWPIPVFSNVGLDALLTKEVTCVGSTNLPWLQPLATSCLGSTNAGDPLVLKLKTLGAAARPAPHPLPWR